MSRPFLAPIATGTVNDAPVRFYVSPRGGPDVPWSALEDLLAAMGLSRSTRRAILTQGRALFPTEFREVATVDGRVVLASHATSQVFIRRVVEAGGEQAGSEDYKRIVDRVLAMLVSDMHPDDAAQWLIAACEREGELK